MNLEQALSLIRTLLAAGGPVAGLLTIYGYPADKTALWLGLALAILPPLATALWGIFSKTDRAMVLSATNVPGVTVQVDKAKAGQSVIDTANDPAVPKVT